MAHFNVTHSSFFDTRLNDAAPANSVIVNGEVHAADLIRRLTNCGCVDAKATELTPAEFRAIVLARLPQLA